MSRCFRCERQRQRQALLAPVRRGATVVLYGRRARHREKGSAWDAPFNRPTAALSLLIWVDTLRLTNWSMLWVWPVRVGVGVATLSLTK